MFGLGAFLGGVCSFVGSVCGVIGGLCSAVVKSIYAMATNLLPVMDKASSIIGGVAGIFAEKPQQESPAEIARMAEIGAEQGIRIDDFDSTHAYLEKLRAEIQIDRNELEKIDVDKRLAYQAVGTALYIKDSGERLEMDLEDPDFWKFVSAADFTAKEVSMLICSMKERNIEDAGTAALYIKGKLEPGSEEQYLVHGSFADMYQKEYPQLGSGEVNQKIYEIQQKANDFEKNEG